MKWELYPEVIAFPEDGVSPCWTLFLHRAEYVKEWGFLRRANPPHHSDPSLIFTPYTRKRDDELPEWWLRVPKGRDEPRRRPA